MRVAIFVTNAAGVYGGGRLAAFLLAQCLAQQGAEVVFVTNAKPVFYAELQHFGRPGRVALHLTPDFTTELPGGAFDIVIVIPGQSQDRTFYVGARGFARRRGARLVLYNFETPNWFNQLSPTARDEDIWLEWRRCLEDGCLVLSNSRQSMRYAQRYYDAYPETTSFDYWHQPVNVKALARVAPQYRENRVVCFVRPQDPHKGAQDLIDVLSADLRGWTLSLLVGNARLDGAFRDAIEAAARRYQIGIEIRLLASDTDKFIELKRARLLLYPSRFEGYGIPPIEALAAGTPCVCYDLPVLREVCGDALVSVPVGDIAALRQGIRRVIETAPQDWAHLPACVASVADIGACGAAALASLQRYLDTPPPDHAPPDLPPPRGRRPTPLLVHVSALRIDPGGYVEVRGWTPLVDRFDIFITLDGQVLGTVTRGLTRKDVLANNAWVGTSEAGYILVAPVAPQSLPESGMVRVAAFARAADGTVLDNVWRDFDVAASRAPAPKPNPALFQCGEARLLRAADSGVVVGWVALSAPVLALHAFVGTRRLWVQHGLARPEVLANLRGFPRQAPGLQIHLDADDLDEMDAAGGFCLLAITSGGLFAEWIVPQAHTVPASAPEWPADVADGADPDRLPLLCNVRRVTYDEYGVAEFEGWVLSRPRVDVLKFSLGGVFLGEGRPDRYYADIQVKHRAYGDGFCGFQFIGRIAGLANEAAYYRIEFCQGDTTVHVETGVAALSRRAEAVLGADAALLPPGFLDDAARLPVVAMVMEDAACLDDIHGAALRALLAHLRARGHELLLVLHGNPHRFEDDLPRWRALSDAILLVNPVTPLPGPAHAGAVGNRAALQGVLAALAARLPRLRMVMACDPALAAVLPPRAGLADVVVLNTAGADGAPQQRSDVHRFSFAAARRGVRRLGFDAPGLAAQVRAIADPALADGPVLALDAIGVTPKILARAIAQVQPPAAGVRLAVVVDAPPLEPIAALRVRLGLPDSVLPLWPAAIAAATPAQIHALVDIGGGATPVVAAALARGIHLARLRDGAVEAAPHLAWKDAPYAALDVLVSSSSVAAAEL